MGSVSFVFYYDIKKAWKISYILKQCMFDSFLNKVVHFKFVIIISLSPTGECQGLLEKRQLLQELIKMNNFYIFYKKTNSFLS